MPLYVYILASRKDGTLYTGVTNDIAARVHDHKQGRGSRFAAKYGALRLVWYEEHTDPASAIEREKRIKRWRRAWKIALIEAENPDWNELYRHGGLPMERQ